MKSVRYLQRKILSASRQLSSLHGRIHINPSGSQKKKATGNNLTHALIKTGTCFTCVPVFHLKSKENGLLSGSTTGACRTSARYTALRYPQFYARHTYILF